MKFFKKKRTVYPLDETDYCSGVTIHIKHCWKCDRPMMREEHLLLIGDSGYRLCDDCYMAFFSLVLSKRW